MDRVITRPLILSLGLPFPAAHILLGLANLGRTTSPIPALAAMAICVALMVLVTRAGQGRGLSAMHAVLALVGVLTMDVLVNSGLRYGEHPGYAAWHTGAIQMIIVVVAMRQQIRLAWLGAGIFAVLDFASSLIRGLPVIDGLTLVLTPLMWVVIATVVSILLSRSIDQINAYTATERQSAKILARDHARQLSRDEWMTDLDKTTRPCLEIIASGSPTASNRQEFMLLEAQLRDQIRGRSLATPSVLQSARDARARGVRVDLLDDRKSDLSVAVLSEASVQLSEAMDRAQRGSVKGRALPAGSGVAVTVLAYDESVPGEEFYLEIRE